MEGIYIVDLLPGAANWPDFIEKKNRLEDYQAPFHSKEQVG